jgi:hypothetical protein
MKWIGGNLFEVLLQHLYEDTGENYEKATQVVTKLQVTVYITSTCRNFRSPSMLSAHAEISGHRLCYQHMQKLQVTVYVISTCRNFRSPSVLSAHVHVTRAVEAIPFLFFFFNYLFAPLSHFPSFFRYLFLPLCPYFLILSFVFPPASSHRQQTIHLSITRFASSHVPLFCRILFQLCAHELLVSSIISKINISDFSALLQSHYMIILTYAAALTYRAWQLYE